MKGFRFTLQFGFSVLRFVVCVLNIRIGVIFGGQKFTVEGSRVSQCYSFGFLGLEVLLFVSRSSLWELKVIVLVSLISQWRDIKAIVFIPDSLHFRV